MVSKIARCSMALAISIATIAPLTAGAPQKSFADRVAKAKASLKESADKAFLRSWQETSDAAEKAGINPTQVRTWHLWAALGTSLGVCRHHALASDRADWLTKLDEIDTGGGEYAAEAKRQFRQLGLESYDETTPAHLAELTSAEQKQYCTIELAAVRQILTEMR